MKITSVQSFHIGIPYEHGAAKRAERATQDAVYVKVETDTGLFGWGEAFGFGACRMSHLAIQNVVAPMAIGRDPSDIPALMTDLFRRTQNMSRNGPVTFALSGLDIALWDIAGKAVGKPLCELIGGAKRETIRAYASLLRIGDADAVRKVAGIAKSRGYTHVKLHERTVECVAAAREALGPDVALMLDTNCQWSVDEAIEMARRMKPFNLAWLEEPIYPPDDFDGLARLRREGGLPVAAGENLGNLMDFRHMLALGAVDVIQPDVVKMGGVTEMVKALEMARQFGARVDPHSPLYGPALIATLHILVAQPEEALGEFYFADLEANPVGRWGAPRDGFFDLPHGPGLGVEVDESLLARYRLD